MQKYTLKERKKNGITIRLTGDEWNKIATLNDGEWTTHSRRGQAIGVRYGCTLHVYKDGLDGEFDWKDLNCPEELDCNTNDNLTLLIDLAIKVALAAVVTASSAVLFLK